MTRYTAQKRSQPTLHATEGSQPKYFRKRSALLGQQTLGHPLPPPRTRGPFSTRMDPGLAKDCFINYTSPRIHAFRTSQDTGFFDCPGLHGNINFLRIMKPVLHIAGGSVFCGVPWSTKTFRILKIHGQSPLGCKVSSCSVYLCYLFIDTGCVWYGHYHWNF